MMIMSKKRKILMMIWWIKRKKVIEKTLLIATKRHGDPFNKEPSSLRQKGSADMFPIKDKTILIFLSFTRKRKKKKD